MKRYKDFEITPPELFFNRRKFIQSAGAAGAALGFAGRASAQDALTPTDEELLTTYNNYYEFGLGKEDPAKRAGDFTTKPWEIEISGLFDKTGTFDIGDVLGGLTVHDRTYRFRCVEAWAAVVPWNGIQLSDILNKFGVQSSAKYIAFETALRPEEMPGTRQPVLDWPYREGLRLDEAMHPLTLMATGLYGKDLPNQNGAPIRLVVPWKYGFKSIKSIVRITAQEEMPYATWQATNAREYGFYANVNPNVDHPRWSQGSERVLGQGIFDPKQDTLMFNGYDEVASLYDGMDLTVDF